MSERTFQILWRDEFPEIVILRKLIYSLMKTCISIFARPFLCCTTCNTSNHEIHLKATFYKWGTSLTLHSCILNLNPTDYSDNNRLQGDTLVADGGVCITPRGGCLVYCRLVSHFLPTSCTNLPNQAWRVGAVTRQEGTECEVVAGRRKRQEGDGWDCD